MQYLPCSHNNTYATQHYADTADTFQPHPMYNYLLFLRPKYLFVYSTARLCRFFLRYVEMFCKKRRCVKHSLCYSRCCVLHRHISVRPSCMRCDFRVWLYGTLLHAFLDRNHHFKNSLLAIATTAGRSNRSGFAFE